MEQLIMQCLISPYYGYNENGGDDSSDANTEWKNYDPDDANTDNAGADDVDYDNDDYANSEDYSVNDDGDADNREDYSVNGETDADYFGDNNARSINAGTYNSYNDLYTTDADDYDSGSNENGDPDDTGSQHDPTLLSDVVQCFLDLVSLVGYVHLKPWHWRPW